MIGYYFDKQSLLKFCKYLLDNPLPGYEVCSSVHSICIRNSNFCLNVIYRYSKYEILSSCNITGIMYNRRHLMNAKYTDEIPQLMDKIPYSDNKQFKPINISELIKTL